MVRVYHGAGLFQDLKASPRCTGEELVDPGRQAVQPLSSNRLLAAMKTMMESSAISSMDRADSRQSSSVWLAATVERRTNVQWCLAWACCEDKHA
jgi:hypothetical protein